MDTARVYQNSGGQDRTIHQMVREEPDWAANLIQEGEDAIAENARLMEVREPGSCQCSDDEACRFVRERDALCQRVKELEQEEQDLGMLIDAVKRYPRNTHLMRVVRMIEGGE